MDENDPRLVSLWPLLGPDGTQSSAAQVPATVSVSRLLLRSAMTCLLQDNFMFRHEFSTFEALLMVIYCLSHNESVDQGWGLLGMALNIGVALRCNIDQNLGPVQTERRRRCWAGLLTLHTYQGMLFRDVDMSYLLDIEAIPPADINDSDVTDEGVLQSYSRGEPTQMSVMMAKLRLFRLSTRICRHISGPSRLDQRLLNEFDDEIAGEQGKWDSMYMVDGSPNILDPNGYAYWCVLQTYAHHLYLLLHRPFHHSKSPSFLKSSRDKCISSSAAMISIHKQLYEAPLLRNFLWLLSGVTSLKALHAAVALNSCIQDLSMTVDMGYDLDFFRAEIGTLTLRMKDLSGRSKICSRAYQVLDHLQTHPGSGSTLVTSMRSEIENLFEDWADVREWLDTNVVNWAAAVQVYGKAKVYVDSKSAETSEYLASQINAVTHHVETNIMGFGGKGGNPEQWKVSDATDRYIEHMKKAIIDVKIKIEHFEGKFKMSQEETRGDSGGVIAGFRELGTEMRQRVADLVEERRDIMDRAKTAQL
ncbi:hypothetical protein NW762_003122 [Fusarium torreyae]|uniref:Transcription factor domain-containing protein n=1 Tax=Fusarium torreyae TaxID=1237075 RepID=A0A9W8S7V6_9HYPO|nr:hypothetical protein NW762_003122 [Fusarium torreyae]